MAAPGAAIWQPPLEPVDTEVERVPAPLAGVPPAVAATGTVPLPNSVWPPKFEPRFAYGGSQSDCEGAGAGIPQGETPPSKLAGPAQISVAGSG